MSWRALEPEQILTLYAQMGGSPGARDIGAVKKLLDDRSPAEIALAVVWSSGSGVSLWDLVYAWPSAIPRDRIAVEMQLVLALRDLGLIPRETSIPWYAYLAYEDLRDGLGIPNAPLATAFAAAKQTLENWLDTDFLALPTPNRAITAQRRATKPRTPRRTPNLRDYE